MVWRRKRSWVLQREGNPGCGKRQEKERAVHRGLHKENTSLSHRPGKREGLIFCEFYNQWESKTKVLEVASMAS